MLTDSLWGKNAENTRGHSIKGMGGRLSHHRRFKSKKHGDEKLQKVANNFAQQFTGTRERKELTTRGRKTSPLSGTEGVRNNENCEISRVAVMPGSVRGEEGVGPIQEGHGS